MANRLLQEADQVLSDRPRVALPWHDVAAAQAAYYLVTGLWPLIHIRSFVAVTGPKTDLWLVKTAGVLISVIGVVLGMGAARRSAEREMAVLGMGSAAGLTGIDVIYVTRHRIPPIYLLDAVAELVLIAGWALSRRSPRS